MLALFKHHKVLFALTLLFSLINALLTVAAAFILQSILDSVVNGDWELFMLMIWIVVGYIAVVFAMAIGSALVEKKLIVEAIQDLRARIHRGILSRDTEQYRQTNTADYLSALTNDIKIVEENILVPFLNAIQYAIVFVLAAVALFIYNPLIGGLMLVCLALMYLLPASLGRPIGKRQEAYSLGLSLFTLKLKDQFSGYEVIRSYRLSDQVKAAFSQQNKTLASNKYAVDRLLAVSEGIAQVIGAGSQIGTMLVAGFLVLNGNMTAGALLAILQLSGAFVQPVAAIMQFIPMIQGAQPVLTRLDELSTNLVSAFSGNLEPSFEKEIVFKDLDFGYQEDRPVLTKLDATFEKGKKYVIAGASGCGKSTLARLLGAEYSTYSGTISVDGNELHTIDVHRFLAQISTIHQDVYMFDESIKDNIDLHRSYSPEQWHRALRLSGVDRFLDQMEQGLDSPVGEDGSNLSGGQRQRVAVARALIENKPILILDEGTSAVDVQTAYDIEQALLEIDELTLLTITHNFRPELLQRYDAILFLDEGRVAEAGSYEELVSKKGAFDSFMHVGG